MLSDSVDAFHTVISSLKLRITRGDSVMMTGNELPLSVVYNHKEILMMSLVMNVLVAGEGKKRVN